MAAANCAYYAIFHSARAILALDGEEILMILETERLILREMKQNDFQDLAEILQNPKVMYAYEYDFSDNDVQVWLDRQIDRYKKYGFGLWAIVLKNTNAMIGQAGLTMQPYKNTEVLEIIPEKIISQDMSLSNTVEMIIKDIFAK